LHYAAPGSGQLFYLRTLLNYVKGPTCYDDIKTINNIKYDTFKDACFALGLLDDDREFIDAILEASHWGTGNFLRCLFATLLLSGQINRPEVVWDKTWKHLSDDILYRQRQLFRLPGMIFTFCLLLISLLLIYY
jgi:hypothetical protein